MLKHPGFFDNEDREVLLEEKNNGLQSMNSVLDFEIFRSVIEEKLNLSRGSKGGRPPFDPILMLRILFLQSLYNLSDEGMEYCILDRLSFMRFLNLHMCDKVPDAKTIWLYRERFKTTGLHEIIFNQLEEHLRANNYMAKGGQIIDATIVKVPQQKIDTREMTEIKNGEIPQAWKNNPSKLVQKDRDARWTKKNSKSFYGYKNHISIDKKNGFIRKYETTEASRHDSQVFEEILDDNNSSEDVWADSAYQSEKIDAVVREKKKRLHVIKKKKKGKPLSEVTKRANKKKSKTRARVEHVFAVLKDQMKLFIRSIGIERAKVKIGLANIVYNVKRLVFLEKKRGMTG